MTIDQYMVSIRLIYKINLHFGSAASLIIRLLAASCLKRLTEM
jgi:hypothetical protein